MSRAHQEWYTYRKPVLRTVQKPQPHGYPTARGKTAHGGEPKSFERIGMFMHVGTPSCANSSLQK